MGEFRTAMRTFRHRLADLLRAIADEIEPVRTITWGPGIGDAPITVGKPIQLPDEWLDWPGKAQGEPRPGIIWFRGERDLPCDQVKCRAKLDGTLPPGCMLRDDEEAR